MAAGGEQRDVSLDTSRLRFQRWGRLAAPVLALAVYLAAGTAEGLSPDGRAVAAAGALMAVLWMTEGLPLPATSLLPLVLFPVAGVLPFDQAAVPYASQYIFLFLGGFMIAQAIERWGLHRRIALGIVCAVGTEPPRLIAGFMLATALLSMWISNTACTMMMLPIALSVSGLLAAPRQEGEEESWPPVDNFSVSLLLGVAYAASIGGMGTLIGTPPNALLAGFLAERGIVIGFAQWMAMGLPLVAVMLCLTWLLLTQVVFPAHRANAPEGSEAIYRARDRLGRTSRGEWIVLGVFVATAATWVVRGPLSHWTWLVERVPAVGNLNDATIAMAGALALFAIPVDRKRGQFALDWETAAKIPWGILLLFGGGLSLAAAAGASGLTEWIGGSVRCFSGVSTVVLMLVVSLLVIFLTELTSNTATSAAFLPIGFGLALGLDVEPMLLLVPSTLAASCAFMLPVATPPNAIIFGSGRVTIGQMAKAGFWLNLTIIALIPPLMYTLGARVLGIRL